MEEGCIWRCERERCKRGTTDGDVRMITIDFFL